MSAALPDSAAVICVKLCVYIAKTSDKPEIPTSRLNPTDYRAFFRAFILQRRPSEGVDAIISQNTII